MVCMTFTDWFRGRTSVWFVLLLLIGLEEGLLWFVLLLLIGLEDGLLCGLYYFY
jgi:hypothetical protein